MDEAPTPDPGHPGAEVVTQNVNCQICGRSVRGLPINGDCPNCNTPVALSVVEQLAPVATSISMTGDVLVPEDRLCVKCRHNLRNLPAEGFCPECRTPIRESAPLAIAPGQKVTDDRPCLTCGYNLKGIETSGNCPECGTPVAKSLRGFLLRYSAPEYIAALRRGILMVEVSLILVVVLAVTAFTVAIVLNVMGSMPSSNAPVSPGKPTAVPGTAGWSQASQAIIGLVGTLVSVISFWGWWLISNPDPAMTTADPGDKSRRFMRAFLAISAAITGVSLVVTMVPALNPNLAGTAAGFPIPITAGVLVGAVGAIAWIVGFIASMTYMSHLARRMPNASLHKRSKQYRWMLPVVGIFGYPLCGAGPLIVFILYVTFIDEWRRRLRDLNKSIMQDDLEHVARTS